MTNKTKTTSLPLVISVSVISVIAVANVAWLSIAGATESIPLVVSAYGGLVAVIAGLFGLVKPLAGQVEQQGETLQKIEKQTNGQLHTRDILIEDLHTENKKLAEEKAHLEGELGLERPINEEETD